jgi:hypothetical protein
VDAAEISLDEGRLHTDVFCDQDVCHLSGGYEAAARVVLQADADMLSVDVL